MRYSKDETAYILAEFTTGDAVTIDIYKLSDDSKVVDGVNVSEISFTGTFKYLLDIVVTEKTEFLLIMSNGVTDKRGKLVLGGYPDDLMAKLVLIGDDVSFVREIESGRWKIDKNNNQMIFYKSDNTTIIATFDLKDSDGTAAYKDVFERVLV